MFGKTFKTFLLLSLINQSGHIGFGPRYRLMSPDDGGDNGGGDDGDDKNKQDKDGKYPKEFVEKLLREKNNFKSSNDTLKAEIEVLKKAPAKKDDQTSDEAKALLKAKDDENKALKAELDAGKKEKKEAMKLGTLKMEFDKNGGQPKQWELITKLADTDKIMIDEDSGVVYGAESEIKRLKELAPAFFGKPAKGAADGDTSQNNQHDADEDSSEEAKKKAIEDLKTKRLKKDKDGKNPLVAYYAAHGMLRKP